MDSSLIATGVQWGIPGVLALVFAFAALQRVRRLEDRLNEVEDFRSREMVDVIRFNTASYEKLTDALRSNTAAVDKLRVHCLMHTQPIPTTGHAAYRGVD
jgi:hypothetical protein